MRRALLPLLFLSFIQCGGGIESPRGDRPSTMASPSPVNGEENNGGVRGTVSGRSFDACGGLLRDERGIDGGRAAVVYLWEAEDCPNAGRRLVRIRFARARPTAGIYRASDCARADDEVAVLWMTSEEARFRTQCDGSGAIGTVVVEATDGTTMTLNVAFEDPQIRLSGKTIIQRAKRGRCGDFSPYWAECSVVAADAVDQCR